jgi:hypothetical protein
VSARIIGIGVKTEKLGLKRGSRDLSVINLDLKRLRQKKPGARLKINPKQKG